MARGKSTDVMAQPPAPTTLETRPAVCLLCGSAEGRIIYRDRIAGIANLFCLKRCRNCGLVYLDPMPTAAAVESYYSSGWPGSPTFAPCFFTFNEELVAVGDRRLRLIERMLGRRGRVLDVGCGYGEFLTAARAREWESWGLEVAPACLEHLRLHLPWANIYEGDAAGFQPPQAQFDLITLWHVLEHLIDPLAALTALRGALKPGGLLVAEMPNLGGLRTRIRKRPMVNQLHLWHVSPSTFRLLLERAGWECLALRLQDHRARRGPLSSALRRARIAVEQAAFRCTGQTLGSNLTAYARPLQPREHTP